MMRYDRDKNMIMVSHQEGGSVDVFGDLLDCVRKAVSAAYEDAAKIAERRIPPPEMGRVLDHHLCSRDAALADCIAADIRARAKGI